MKSISLVIPAYNEEKNIRPLYREIKKSLKNFNYEIIFVNDGSTDDTEPIIRRISEKDKKVKIISYNKNKGKSFALSRGFKRAKNNLIVTLDCDLQDDPKEIPELIKKMKNYDMLVGWRKKRKDFILKKFSSKIYNKMTSLITGIKLHDMNSGLKVLKKKVIKDINLYGGFHRYLPVLAANEGYRVGEVVVNHRERKYGKAKYSFSRILTGWLDLMTIKFLFLFSDSPLHFFGTLGMIVFGIGFLINLYLLYVKYFLNELIGERPLLILGVLLIIFGAQTFFMGLLGEMVNKSNRR